MNLLRIEQTYGKIGIDTYNSKLDINSKQIRLDMKQRQAQVKIKQELPRVLIDQHECFATAGLKNNMEILEDAAQAADQQALIYTAKKAEDGDMLANIKYRGNPIADIARRDSISENEFNIDLIPKARPKIEVTGEQKIDFEEAQISTNFENGYVDINFTKPEIRMYLLQKPSINIQYVGNNIDVKV